MTTDAERREATDQWTSDLREQQLRDLRAQLATATQRAEAAEARVRELEQHLFEISNGVTLTTTNDMLRYPRATE